MAASEMYQGWTPTDPKEWARTFYQIQEQTHYRIKKAKGIHCECYICDQLREWECEDMERMQEETQAEHELDVDCIRNAGCN